MCGPVFLREAGRQAGRQSFENNRKPINEEHTHTGTHKTVLDWIERMETGSVNPSRQGCANVARTEPIREVQTT